MYVLGSLFLETNQRKKAIDVFHQSLQINPKHSGSLNSLAYVYAEDGANLDEAETLASRALQVDPDNGAYLDSLAWVYFKKGKYEEAIKTLQSAEQQLKDPIIYEHLGDVNYKLDRFDNAEKYWEQSLELNPGQTEVVKKLNDLKKVQAKSN